MDLKTFTRIAQAAFDAIPQEYRQGVDGLVIERSAEPHPTLPGIHTLGVCETESWPSDWVGPDTTRSTIVLYYGSFRALARLDPDFDWEAEIHETVEHEVRHHLESLAGEDQLEEVDYAMDESFKRAHGLQFDPWFYQHGDRIGPGVYAVEDQVFIERELEPAGRRAAPATGEATFRWQGRDFAVPAPQDEADLHFVLLHGIQEPPPWIELVLVRREGWLEGARRLLGRRPPVVRHSEAEARTLAEPPG